MRALMRSPPLAAVLTAFLVSSCGDDLTTTVPTDDPEIIVSIVSGEGQVWYAGHELPHALVVKVTRHCGWKHRDHHCNAGVPDYLVNFRVTKGDGSVFAGSARTDSLGIAQDYWTLGREAGENVLEVRSVNPTTGEKQVWARFTATGLEWPEELTTVQGLLSDAWVLEVVDRLEPGVACDLREAFDVAVDGLGDVLDLEAVGDALTCALAVVETSGPPNLVEYTFLDLILSHAKTLFDQAMLVIIN
jgi:hypothetical protein